MLAVWNLDNPTLFWYVRIEKLSEYGAFHSTILEFDVMTETV